MKDPDQAVSAKTGQNLANLTEAVCRFLMLIMWTANFSSPFDNLGAAHELRNRAHILSEEFTPEGVVITAEVDRRTGGKYSVPLGNRNKAGFSGSFSERNFVIVSLRG